MSFNQPNSYYSLAQNPEDMPGENPTTDYRELIDEKFSGVYARMEAFNEMQHLKLDKILKETGQTNGKVAELERRMRLVENFQGSCQLPEIRKEVKQLMDETAPTRAIWGNHSLRRWVNVGKFVAALSIIAGLFYLLIRIVNTIQ